MSNFSTSNSKGSTRIFMLIAMHHSYTRITNASNVRHLLKLQNLINKLFCTFYWLCSYQGNNIKIDNVVMASVHENSHQNQVLCCTSA